MMPAPDVDAGSGTAVAVGGGGGVAVGAAVGSGVGMAVAVGMGAVVGTAVGTDVGSTDGEGSTDLGCVVVVESSPQAAMPTNTIPIAKIRHSLNLMSDTPMQ